MGAGFWLTDREVLRAKAEELAKAQYSVRKDPADAALLYMALGKKLLLQVAYFDCTTNVETHLKWTCLLVHPPPGHAHDAMSCAR